MPLRLVRRKDLPLSRQGLCVATTQFVHISMAYQGVKEKMRILCDVMLSGVMLGGMILSGVMLGGVMGARVMGDGVWGWCIRVV